MPLSFLLASLQTFPCEMLGGAPLGCCFGAFLALAKRSSGVMFLAAVFPLAPELACNLSYRFLDFSRNPRVHALH